MPRFRQPAGTRACYEEIEKVPWWPVILALDKTIYGSSVNEQATSSLDEGHERLITGPIGREILIIICNLTKPFFEEDRYVMINNSPRYIIEDQMTV
jgi:hypothetical protein